MTLDTELMNNEFMHGFGDYTIGIRECLYDIAAASKKFELIPEKIGECDNRKHYQEDSALNPKDKTRVDSNIANACKFYRVLDGLVNEVAKQNDQYSHCFKLVQTFMRLLKQSIYFFEEYLKLHKDDADFEQSFLPYLPQLEVAVLSINGIMEVRKIYDSTTNDEEVRIRWHNKHPEFNRCGWKTPEHS